MEQSVRRAMARWPQVPQVFGWLRLDSRGQWWIKHERITRSDSRVFIANNYESDPMGRMFFQNGPQRVFVALDETPWILHLNRDGLVTHTDLPVLHPRCCYLDELGQLYVEMERGLGLVDDRDLASMVVDLYDHLGRPLQWEHISTHGQTERDLQVSTTISQAPLPIHFIDRAALPARFGFIREPSSTDGL